MIYFISDFHFGDIRMLKTRERFTSIEDMERELINNYNKVVTNNDVVWILGDIAGDLTTALNILPKLNGKKFFIIGNHDRKWIFDPKINKYFEKIYESTVITIDNIPVTLSHYPLYQWYKSKYGGVLIHGHLHEKSINYPFYKSFCAFDVSAEKINYQPISWDEIKKIFKEDKKILFNELVK